MPPSIRKPSSSVLGIPVGVWIYRIAVISAFVIMVAGVFVGRVMTWPLLLYFLFGLPASVAAINFVNVHDVSTPGPTQHRACAITIILHLIGCLALAIGFIISSFILRQIS